MARRINRRMAFKPLAAKLDAMPQPLQFRHA